VVLSASAAESDRVLPVSLTGAQSESVCYRRRGGAVTAARLGGSGSVPGPVPGRPCSSHGHPPGRDRGVVVTVGPPECTRPAAAHPSPTSPSRQACPPRTGTQAGNHGGAAPTASAHAAAAHPPGRRPRRGHSV
jgi:hypothetical protein